MKVRINALAAVGSLTAVLISCMAPVAPTVDVRSESRPIDTPDALTRALAAEPGQVLAAAEDVLARFGLAPATVDPADPAGADGLVLSEWTRVQTTWAGSPVSAWLICGVPTESRVELVWDWLRWPGFRPMDLGPAAALTDAVPVELRVGVSALPRVGGTSARLLVEAAGVRPQHAPHPPTREIGCVPTQAFVETVFGLLAGGAPGP